MPIGFVLDYLQYPLFIAVADYKSYAFDTTQLSRRPLRIAAGGYDKGFWIESVSQPQQLTALSISDVGYGARVQYIDIRGILGSNNLVTGLEESAS
jgi:hypothetical protein